MALFELSLYKFYGKLGSGHSSVLLVTSMYDACVLQVSYIGVVCRVADTFVSYKCRHEKDIIPVK